MEAIVIGGLVSLVLAYFWYDKNKSDADLKAFKTHSNTRFDNISSSVSLLSNKQTAHANVFVTDQRVRDIVKDEISPLKEDVAQMKMDVGKIMDSLQELTTELRVHNAIRDYEKSKQ